MPKCNTYYTFGKNRQKTWSDFWKPVGSIFEGFGIPILEALFCKTPVITSKDGCFSEAGGPNTKYINPLSIQELKEAIGEILNSSDLQKKMQTKGFEYAQNFKDDRIATNLMEVFKGL